MYIHAKNDLSVLHTHQTNYDAPPRRVISNTGHSMQIQISDQSRPSPDKPFNELTYVSYSGKARYLPNSRSARHLFHALNTGRILMPIAKTPQQTPTAHAQVGQACNQELDSYSLWSTAVYVYRIRQLSLNLASSPPV